MVQSYRRLYIARQPRAGAALRTVDHASSLRMLSAPNWGGVPRPLNIVSVSIAGTIAAAETQTSSIRSDMTSFLHLVKEKDGQWLVVGDTAVPTPKKAKSR